MRNRSCRLAINLWLPVLCGASLALAAGCNVASNGLNAEGTRYYQSGQQTAAMAKFQDAMAADPKNADSYYNMGAVYHQLAKSQHNTAYYSQAEHYYQQCLDLDRNHPECYRGLAVLLAEEQRTGEAVQLLTDWTRRNPTSADAHVELARLQQELGNRAEAEKQLLEAVAVDTSHSRARAALGKLREESGDYNQAMVNFNASLASNPLQPDLQARMAALSSTVPATPSPTPAGGPRVVSLPTLESIR
ncbi:MAG: tetratricopeptide repeat protein [Planctomycetia bacterium]|nr:tetratricopeptide repeat protein [Planctomycetia bacterium]